MKWRPAGFGAAAQSLPILHSLLAVMQCPVAVALVLAVTSCVGQAHVCAAGDVGLARIMDATHLATGLAPCGTFAYAAPEMLMGTRCSEKVVSAVCHACLPASQMR